MAGAASYGCGGSGEGTDEGMSIMRKSARCYVPRGHTAKAPAKEFAIDCSDATQSMLKGGFLSLSFVSATSGFLWRVFVPRHKTAGEGPGRMALS